VDYRDGTSTLVPSATTSGTSSWDTSPWDTTPWAGPITTQLDWLSVAAIGWNAAVRLRTMTDSQSVRWLATDVRFEPGQGGF